MKENEVAPRRPRGRPPRQVENRPTACPDGHRGRLLLWGRRTWASTPYRRQRMKCLPSDGTPAHTFSIGRRQAAASHPHGEECPTCDVRPGLALGPVARTNHFHTANEIARLLQLAGRGTSLRRSSLTVRLESHHYVEDHHVMRRASRAFALAARYLDLFALRIDEHLAPKRWPGSSSSIPSRSTSGPTTPSCTFPAGIPRNGAGRSSRRPGAMIPGSQ